MLSCVGSAAVKVVSCASAVEPSKTIPVPPTIIPDVEVPDENVNVSIVGLVKVLFVNVSLPVNVAGSEPIVNVTFNYSHNSTIYSLIQLHDLNILSGDDAADSGNVIYRKDIKISFLSQDPKFDNSLTIEETIFASENPILKIISNYEKALLNPDDADSYQAAFEAVKEVMGESCELIETLACKINEEILSRFEIVSEVKVQVVKTNPPIVANMEEVTFELTCVR